jgi:fructose-1,6-bisphosphatase/inositol monophosphatase family enzyme
MIALRILGVAALAAVTIAAGAVFMGPDGQPLELIDIAALIVATAAWGLMWLLIVGKR